MEIIIKDQKQMIQYLHKQAEDHVKTRNMLIEMNEELEREINDKDEEIVKLKKKLKEVKLKDLNDVDKLVEEIELIKKSNQEKESFLVHIEQENKILKQNLFEVEHANEDLKEQMKHKRMETEHVESLSDELGIKDPRSHNVSPECEGNVRNSANLKNHMNTVHGKSLVTKIWQLKVLQLEQSISSQKLRLASDILELKENESNENKLCTCKSFCRIVHQKHNWSRPPSQDILTKFKLLKNSYTCSNCDETFQNVDCLNLHVKRVHEEMHNGGVIVRNTSSTSGGILL